MYTVYTHNKIFLYDELKIIILSVTRESLSEVYSSLGIMRFQVALVLALAAVAHAQFPGHKFGAPRGECNDSPDLHAANYYLRQ